MSSAEVVVKKRGRPKKVVAEVAELEVVDAEAPKKATRAKSTKATKTTKKAVSTASTAKSTTKTTSAAKKAADSAEAAGSTSKATASAARKLAKESGSTSKPTKDVASSSKPVPTTEKTTRVATKVAGASAISVEPTPHVKAAEAEQETCELQQAATKTSQSDSAALSASQSRVESTPNLITPEESRILQQVHDLPQNPFKSSQQSSKETAGLPATANIAPPSLSVKAESISSSSEPSITTAAKKSPKPTMPPTPPKPKASPTKPVPVAAKKAPLGAPKAKIPIAALNSAIVSNISARAGARPTADGSRPLPPNYKPVARKVTMAIVAMPILIVTSYVLYQRLALGEDQKRLVPLEPSAVESDADKSTLIKPKET
ncbi:hypothetical protein BP5796_08312 [Coleophoma crateriformis]|uniref:Uncharacterized protein n=1 Tax=Coleophoma crateriformis TaxID=565419 RepID=A0A3D8R784_9HELO|nr:hypothetical protein BP5796_08312 [Coleophoma crateriformis]